MHISKFFLMSIMFSIALLGIPLPAQAASRANISSEQMRLYVSGAVALVSLGVLSYPKIKAASVQIRNALFSSQTAFFGCGIAVGIFTSQLMSYRGIWTSPIPPSPSPWVAWFGRD